MELVAAVLVLAGLVMLCFGGNWLVSGGTGIARRLGISPVIIGMTIVAYGTSTPELAASMAAAGEHGEIILGNIVGSNIANVGMVIGIAAVLAAIAVKKDIRTEILLMIGFSLLLVVLSIDGMISRYDGVLLIGLLVAFTLYSYMKAKRTIHADVHDAKSGDTYVKSGGLIAVGVVLLGAGAWLTIENAVVLARSFGLSERIIGITVIAIGTSLPELITSVIAVKRGQTGIGIGNIVGSNIYNILMITGAAAVIAGITVAPQTFIDYTVMIGFSLVLLAGLATRIIGRRTGIGLVIGYAAYLLAMLLAT